MTVGLTNQLSSLHKQLNLLHKTILKGAVLRREKPVWRDILRTALKIRTKLQKFGFSIVLCGAVVQLQPMRRENTTSLILQQTTVTKALEHTSKYLYSHQQLNFYYFILAARILKFILYFTPLLLMSPLLFCGEQAKALWIDASVFALERYGGAMVKLGQWASTRPDIFSVEFCNTMARLQRHVTPHDFSYTKFKLKQRFGSKWQQLIKRFDKQPVGSGCAAQVYKAYLDSDAIKDEDLAEHIRGEYLNQTEDTNWLEAFEIVGFHRDTTEDSNTNAEDIPENLIPIAIKVLHPGIRQEILLDLDILRFLAWWSELLVPPLKYLSLVDGVKEFSNSMIRQIDLREEAKNFEIFTENFADDKNIRFPRPIRPYVWRDVIVESFEDGEPISHFLPGHVSGEVFMEEVDTDDLDKQTDVAPNTANNSSDQHDITQDDEVRKRLAELGLDALLKMIFAHNFVHADMHPGNLAVQLLGSPDKVNATETVELVHLFDTVMVKIVPREEPLTLIVYDCGLVTRLSDEKSRSMREVFTSIVQSNGQRVAELFLENSKISKFTDQQKFVSDMKDLIETNTKDGLHLSNLEVGALLKDFFGTLARHRVRLDSDFINIMIAVVVLEGLGKSLHADIDLMSLLRSNLISSALT